MELKWTSKAVSDLKRLHDFLAQVNRPAASKTVQLLAAAPSRLIDLPRLGEKLEEFAPREVRSLFVSRYEIRYEIQNSKIFVLRIWHSRQSR